ncbi:MAG: Acyl-CoA dehydrogenase C-terminal domain-containing protein [Bacteroidales bacterium]|jgi:alkylation response protein AidB-like acyl-CoA dehydrogenase|nr:Acyl-CoA dehydrogenase C-terminal domain-containing protein [Bacteroidales bacterium]MDD3274086.1 Acyl-CoA dehydrogenase C-terminal domain-containing protein [Bacteroidales bacterium]MDD4057644.1 Acyl-CoA dehydrogenase C-terminal domain-containing protein [Bacteroidales bacterium]
MANFYKDNKDLKFQFEHPLMKKIVALKEQDFKESGQFDYAPCTAEDAIDSYDKVMEIMGEISGDVIAVNAENVDQSGPVHHDGRVYYASGTKKNQDVLTQAGMYGMALPREFGGLNFSMVPYVMSAEIVARADAGFANIWGLQDCAETINEYASDDIKKEFLPRINCGETCSMDLTEPDAGSDLQAVMLKASYNESENKWYLNGVKRFITNGDAEIKLVLARSEEGTTDGRGLSYFVYDKKWGGVTVRRIENKLGIKGSPTCELVFNNAPAKLVGERKLGLIKYVMSLMNGARLGVGAQSVGISEAAYREALKYAHERTQFGKPIIQFPAVYEMLALIKAKLQASRTLLYETTRFVDIYKAYGFISEERKLTPEERSESKKYQKLADMYTPMLKLMSSEYCNQNAYDSLQIHGGSGFMKDYPIERIYRDARITTIYEGTSQLQVVAAQRYVTNGSYLNQMKDYEQIPVRPEFEPYKKQIVEMTDQYAKTVELISGKDTEYVDFHARRLVEMASHIIMSYLLLLDTQRDESYEPSMEIFIGKSKSWNNERFSYINDFSEFKMGSFLSVKSETSIDA